MPSPRVPPVCTWPKSVSTPTRPVPTLVTELNSKITSKNAAMPSPIRRRSPPPLPPPPSIILPRAGSKIVIVVSPVFILRQADPSALGLLWDQTTTSPESSHSLPHLLCLDL